VTVQPRDSRVATSAELADVLVRPVKISVPSDWFAVTRLAIVVSSSADEQSMLVKLI
jgi:hypothetical protein